MRFVILIIASLAVANCAPIKEFGDGLGRTVDKLVHPKQW